jgi:hypothetical protein
MRAPAAALSTALAVTAALTLAACGGGSSGGSDKIAVPKTTPATTAATTTASPDAGHPLRIDPALALPGDLKVTFTWDMPGDATQAAALTAAADYVQAIDHAVVEQNRNDPPLLRYAADDALAYAQKFVGENVAAKLTVTGTDAYYAPHVTTASGGSSVEVTLCDNQAKLYSKELATGKVRVTQADDDSYVLYDIVLVKFPTKDAIWQAHGITVKEGAPQCKE